MYIHALFWQQVTSFAQQKYTLDAWNYRGMLRTSS